MADGSNNARFLSKIDSKSKSMILENIAKHYGISTQEAFSEVTDSEAEHLLDYMTEPARSAASVLMQKHGLRGFSRPGAKARFKVEDCFYFGKGRKERFADDAKQIADTILKQLGGGRFIAMTGAKNLAFSSSPPGLRMSIGRGAKDAIKYLRVDYDRGSDTYTMIFANKSGGTVKSVSHVYADSLQRVFTSTTGFDTHL